MPPFPVRPPLRAAWLAAWLAPVASATACAPADVPTGPETPGPGPAATGDGLFLRGCPEAGRAAARLIESPEERPWGNDALAAPGDALLLNERAAFVVQGPDDPRTYYHYGGIPIDGVAVAGCEQAGPERLGEIGFVVGRLDLAEFTSSSLHQFRADTVEVVSDGSDGGPAVVEARGTDDRFWLVELTLVREAYVSGGSKDLGDLYGLDVTVRYTLAPGSASLEVEVLLGGQPTTDGFMVGALLFPSDHTPSHAFAGGDLSVGGFGLSTGVPWFASAGADGAIAVAMPGSSLALTTLSGVTALVDTNQAFVPIEVGDGQGTDGIRLLISVGATDAASASAALEPLLPEPLPGMDAAWADVAGAVADPAGQPVPGALVEVEALDDGGGWRLLDRLVADEAGEFAGRTLGWGPNLRLRASGAGRDPGEGVEVASGLAVGVTLDVGASGAIDLAVTDDAGTPIPARFELEREDGRAETIYAVPGDGLHPLPPGRWHAWVSRGYEYAIVEADVEVPADGAGAVTVSLARLVDTAGWASFDSHVHAEPSADSATLPELRMRSAAAAGLDAVISTDHEAIVDLGDAPAAAGVADHLLYVLGSEVTAAVPEHTNAWPFPARPGHARGDPVRWYQHGFPGIYEAERERGAGVVQLNHSRVNGECGILCVLDWDRTTDPPALEDATALGLPEGTEVWSWDFDSFEVMNGLRGPFLDPADPRRTGAFTDWLSFHNLGYRVTGVAVTDVHDTGMPGLPRTYVAVADDLPGGFGEEDLAAAVHAGAAVVSAGAFARFTAGGVGPGGLAAAVGGEIDVDLRVEGIPEIDVRRVDVLVDCDPGLSLPADDPSGVVKLDATVPLTLARDAYVVAVGFGDQPMPRGLGEDADPTEVPRFFTSPVFVDVDGDGAWTPPGPKGCGWSP